MKINQNMFNTLEAINVEVEARIMEEIITLVSDKRPAKVTAFKRGSDSCGREAGQYECEIPIYFAAKAGDDGTFENDTMELIKADLRKYQIKRAHDNRFLT